MLTYPPSAAACAADAPAGAAPFPPAPRHWIIGDVHGGADALTTLISLLPREDRLVFCGDVINRGPRIEAAMEIAWELVQSGRAVWLMGNHERALVDGLGKGETIALTGLAGCDTYRQLGDRRARLWLQRPTGAGAGWPPTPALIRSPGSPTSRCEWPSGRPTTAASAR